MPASTAEQIKDFIAVKNGEYETLHQAFEEQFWGTKMALTGDFTADELTRTKQAMESWLADPGNLKQTREYLQNLPKGVTDFETKTLKIFERTFSCYQMEPHAKLLRAAATAVESVLEQKRNQMKSGYTDPTTGQFTECTSVALRQKIRNDADEATRKAAYEGVRAIGPFICDNGFPEIVKKRNELAKSLGFVDYYDMKVTQAEGFSKERLFQILDDLEQKTRPAMEKARQDLEAKYGADATKPWNTAFALAGDLVKKADPYFPFEKAVLRYATSFANLGISYRGATLNLDLLDRPGKYSNGFCHWPVLAWVKKVGADEKAEEFQPSTANFTSLAIPTSVGSGKTALTTLMHEAGHAAHFANIALGSPLFSQERAPTSVAYAENQSMFLDSLVDDADWKCKYAVSRAGESIPFELIEEAIVETHPFAAFMLRGMIVVPYFEKALYELPAEDLTKEKIMELADEIERRVCGGLQGRPLLSVPHIMSDESSCYYHGYVLAEMSVHQTRKFFLEKYGYLTDNPHIGPELTEAYWRCGNSELFLDLVERLTGKPLTADSWVAEISEPVGEKVASERKNYEAMKEKLGDGGEKKNQNLLATLNMVIRCVHGDEVIVDSREEGSIEAVSAKFEAYVRGKYYN